MNSNTSNTPTDVHVITDMEMYESTIRKAMSTGELNASPLAEPKQYSWSDVEMEEQLAQKTEQTNHTEQPTEPTLQESVILKEEPVTSEPIKEEFIGKELTLVEREHIKELVEKAIKDIIAQQPLQNEVVENVKKSDEDDSDDEMPNLVEDSESMPDLVESENGWTHNPEIEIADDMMIAIFKRPSCPRCEAALKVLMAHDEGSGTGSDSDNEEEHESSEEESEEEDDSDSDYVPSEVDSDESTESDTSDSESEAPRTIQKRRRDSGVPSAIMWTFTLLIFIYILKLMYLMVDASMKQRYHACY